jgi:hypothetical protein
MSYVSAEELELLSFFEVEPSRVDRDVPWPYNEFTYEIAHGQYSISFSIAPACKDLSITVSHGDAELYRLKAVAVKDVRYHKDAELETLEIVISDSDRIWFRIRPSLLVAQDASEPW